MKHSTSILVGLVIGVAASGCATQGKSTTTYLKPTISEVKNEIDVTKSYAQVWDVLVKQLSKSFYVINNIDKESRIINVSFSTNSPAEYIDCGRTLRTYTQGKKRKDLIMIPLELQTSNTQQTAKSILLGATMLFVEEHPPWKAAATSTWLRSKGITIVRLLPLMPFIFGQQG